MKDKDVNKIVENVNKIAFQSTDFESQKIGDSNVTDRNKRKYSHAKCTTLEDKSKADMGTSIKRKTKDVIDKQGVDNINTNNDNCGNKHSFSVREKDSKTNESTNKLKESKYGALNKKVGDVDVTDSRSDNNGSDDKDKYIDTNVTKKSNDGSTKQSALLKDKHVDKKDVNVNKIAFRSTVAESQKNGDSNVTDIDTSPKESNVSKKTVVSEYDTSRYSGTNFKSLYLNSVNNSNSDDASILDLPSDDCNFLKNNMQEEEFEQSKLNVPLPKVTIRTSSLTITVIGNNNNVNYNVPASNDNDNMSSKKRVVDYEET